MSEIPPFELKQERKERVQKLAKAISSTDLTDEAKYLVLSSNHKELVNAAFSIAARKQCKGVPSTPVDPQPEWAAIRPGRKRLVTQHDLCMASAIFHNYRRALDLFYRLRSEHDA